MRVVEEPEELRRACDEARLRGERVGVVPTMGALHAGHAALVEEAARRAQFVVVTIFVNPTQFGPNEDFARYPRTLEDDLALADRSGAHLVFCPAIGAMYPPGDETRVRVGATAAALCGAHRPVHFEGVTTIVCKLFGLVGPSVAIFGRKDYQQVRVIARMTNDLFLPVEIVAHRTIREPDGLAMSSRNRYLSEADRGRARRIPEALSRAVRAFAEGERRPSELERIARAHVEPAVDSIDYVTVADAESTVPLSDENGIGGSRALLAVAVRVGPARLIDNVVLGEDPAPIALADANAAPSGASP
jgi:pantoate--beta-alanine ligase